MLLLSTEMLASALISINLVLAPHMVLNSTVLQFLLLSKKNINVINCKCFAFQHQLPGLQAPSRYLITPLYAENYKINFSAKKPVFCRLFQYRI